MVDIVSVMGCVMAGVSGQYPIIDGYGTQPQHAWEIGWALQTAQTPALFSELFVVRQLRVSRRHRLPSAGRPPSRPRGGCAQQYPPQPAWVDYHTVVFLLDGHAQTRCVTIQPAVRYDIESSTSVLLTEW